MHTKLSLWLQSALIHLLLLTFFLLVAFVSNHFSSHTLVAGGDFYQLENPQQHAERYRYAWINQIGQGDYNTLYPAYPFYFLLQQFGNLGLDSADIAKVYFFVLVYGSFLGFYLSIRSVFPGISATLHYGSALLYALNNVTLNFFTYPWGYTHHLLFYPFLPPLLLFFYRAVTAKSRQLLWIALLTLTLSLSLIAYNNLAFLALLLLLQGGLILALLITHALRFSKQLFVRLLALAAIYLSAFLPLILSFYLSFRDTIAKSAELTFSSKNLADWVTATSSNFLQTFLFALDGNRYPLVDLDLPQTAGMLLSLGYALVLVWLLIRVPVRAIRTGVVLPFLIVLAGVMLLSVRAYGPFREGVLLLYQLFLANLFRSPEKLFSVLPVLYLVVLVGLISAAKLRARTMALLMFALLMIPFPYYTGAIARSLQEERGTEPGETYHYAVRIPQEYRDIQQRINSDVRIGSIISVPYSVVNSLNWANYPSWHFVGQDILHLLYNKFYISANSYDHPELETLLSFQEFNESRGSPDKLLMLLQKFSSLYVVEHHDITRAWRGASRHMTKMLAKLERRGDLDRVTRNDYFTLYALSDAAAQPLISGGRELWFQRINPSLYRMHLRFQDGDQVVFRQSFNRQWKLYPQRFTDPAWCREEWKYERSEVHQCAASPGQKKGIPLFAFQRSFAEDGHTMVDDFANSWTLSADEVREWFPIRTYRSYEDGSIEAEFLIAFSSQTFLWIVTFVQVSLLGLSTGTILFLVIRERRRVP